MMHNTSSELGYRLREEILENLITKLRLSGYKRKQIVDIVRSGILSYKSKWEYRKNPHRSSVDTEDSRSEKKLTSKTSWFKRKATVPAKTKNSNT